MSEQNLMMNFKTMKKNMEPLKMNTKRTSLKS